MSKPQKKEGLTDAQKLRRAEAVMGLVWVAIIVVCLANKPDFTLERILNYTPSQPLLAALVMLVLFAVKSLSIFLYSGFLYAANGILFSLPAAVLLNIAGTAVMVSIPYWLGKKLGSRAVQYIRERYPKAAALHELRSGSDFFFVLIMRLLGILPADILSAYKGAEGILAACILFPIMGMNISNPSSPQFLIAAGIDLAAMVTSCVVFHFYRKNRHQTA